MLKKSPAFDIPVLTQHWSDNWRF